MHSAGVMEIWFTFKRRFGFERLCGARVRCYDDQDIRFVIYEHLICKINSLNHSRYMKV
jgi:hypothetical protein